MAVRVVAVRVVAVRVVAVRVVRVGAVRVGSVAVGTMTVGTGGVTAKIATATFLFIFTTVDTIALPIAALRRSRAALRNIIWPVTAVIIAAILIADRIVTMMQVV